MISKEYIKDLGFTSKEEFYEYIVESKINGNIQQTKDLINKMSKEQYNDFIGWFLNTGTVFSQSNVNIKEFILYRK